MLGSPIKRGRDRRHMTWQVLSIQSLKVPVDFSTVCQSCCPSRWRDTGTLLLNHSVTSHSLWGGSYRPQEFEPDFSIKIGAWAGIRKAFQKRRPLIWVLWINKSLPSGGVRAAMPSWAWVTGCQGPPPTLSIPLTAFSKETSQTKLMLTVPTVPKLTCPTLSIFVNGVPPFLMCHTAVLSLDFMSSLTAVARGGPERTTMGIVSKG